MLNRTLEVYLVGFVFTMTLNGGLSDHQIPEYVGSASCLSCHATENSEIVESWKKSRHALTAWRQSVEDDDGTAPEQEPFLLLIGEGTEGAVQVDAGFRVQVPEATQLSTTFPPHDELVVRGAGVNAAETCLGCHTTGYSVIKKTFVEPAVGCEACHGPGGDHVDSGGSKESIVNPGRLSADRNRMVCGQCHSLGTDPSGSHPFPVLEKQFPFQPGNDLTLAFIDRAPVTTLQGGEYSTFVNSPSPYSDQLCTDCHNPHGTPGTDAMLVDPTSVLCKRCHSNPLSGIDQVDERSHWGAHRYRCWNCHDYTHLH